MALLRGHPCQTERHRGVGGKSQAFACRRTRVGRQWGDRVLHHRHTLRREPVVDELSGHVWGYRHDVVRSSAQDPDRGTQVRCRHTVQGRQNRNRASHREPGHQGGLHVVGVHEVGSRGLGERSETAHGSRQAERPTGAQGERMVRDSVRDQVVDTEPAGTGQTRLVSAASGVDRQTDRDGFGAADVQDRDDGQQVHANSS